MPETRFHTCNVCEAMCGLAFAVEDGKITSVKGDRDDVFSRGHLCPKGPAMREVLEDPDRLRHPMRRTAAGWQRVSWREALDETGARLAAIQSAHGRDAVGVYVGNPTVHSHGSAIVTQAFLRALRTKNRFDANSQDANPKLFACMLMYGDQLSISIPDVDRTDYFLMLGANPAASNGSVMSLGDVRGRLHGIRERGGRIVLVDPRRTETAAWSDEHVFIRPGGDAAFLLGLLHTLFTEQLVDEAAVATTTRGLAELKSVALRFSPEQVAAQCGIDAQTTRRIAREFAAAPHAVVYGRVGSCTNEFGPTAMWLIEAINVVTGNFDREGGSMFPTPAVDVSRLARRLVGNHFGRWHSRVRGLPEFAGQLPASVMSEEMETPGAGQIRGFVTFAGNPVLSTTNGERLSAALAKLDFMVSIDIYINETSRHAHLILPPIHALERGHYDVVFHALAVRNTAKWSEPVVPPPDGGKDDWEILYELGMRLGGLRFGLGNTGDRALRLLHKAGVTVSPDRIIDVLLRTGTYGDQFNPFAKGLSLARLRKQVHGVDLGPLVPSRRERVLHDGGRVNLAPEIFLGDVARLERRVDDARSAVASQVPELVLIGRRHVRTNNSWMHNLHSLVKGPDRSSLMMHPDDAAQHGLPDGAEVRVTSRTGAVLARLEATDSVMRGVVSLPHGFGHGSLKGVQAIAGNVTGPNINEVTDDQLVDPLLGTAVLNGVPVKVERATSSSR